MEAFILAERVLTAQHMSRQDHKDLKYLKKYDLPSHCVRKRRLPNKSPSKENLLNHTQPLSSKKIKNLLSTIKEDIIGSPHREEHTEECKINQYFSCQSDPSKNVWQVRKSKDTLLFRRIEPQAQHYDANMASVSPKAPCWTFPPHARRIGFPLPPEATQNQPKPLRAKTAEKWRAGTRQSAGLRKRASDSQQYVERGERKIYRQMRERSGLGTEVENRFHYCPLELGKSTAQIFKKYNLIDDPYFKKFLSDIQSMGA